MGRQVRQTAVLLHHRPRAGVWWWTVLDPTGEGTDEQVVGAASSLDKAKMLAREAAEALGYTNLSSRWTSNGPDWELPGDWYEPSYDAEREVWA